jgi:hypothetical protein
VPEGQHLADGQQERGLVDNMVTFLERKQPTLGEKLGAGIERGAERAIQSANQLSMEKAKAKQEFDLFQQYFRNKVGIPPKSTEGMGEKLQSGDTPYPEDSSKEPNEIEEAWLDYKYPKVMEGKREREKASQKKFESDREYHSKRASPFLNKITTMSEGLRERQTAINSSIAAVQSGQMTPLGEDF